MEPRRGTRSARLLRLQRRAAAFVTSSLVVGVVVLAAPLGDRLAGADFPRKIACTKTYTVLTGDYWYGIARKVGV